MLRGFNWAAFLFLLAACSPETLEDRRSECTKQAAGTQDGYVDFEVELAIPVDQISWDIQNYAIQITTPTCEWPLHALMSSATVDSLFETADSQGIPAADEHYRFATAEVFAYKFVRTDGMHAIFVTGVYDLKADVARTQKFEEDLAILRSKSNQ